MLLAAVNSYYLVKGEIQEVSDKNLALEIIHAEGIINQFEKPKNIQLGFDGLSSVKITDPHKDNFFYIDTTIYNVFEKEYETYRMTKTHYNCNNQTYLITFLKPTMKEDELIEGIFSSFAIILVFLILSFFLVSWFISKKLWKPFYNTLSKLDEYDIQKHHTYQFDKSTINEFNQLNTTLTKMTNKLYSDFLQQKEFTENASHEMQTPLAVVKANLSLLMQSPNLKEEEMNQLQSIENTVKKLTSLNKALILLSKIENQQFNESVAVNFNDKIHSILKHHQELIDNKNIVVKTEFKNELIMPFNATLADVLITNLFQNAIRHNYPKGGSIHIVVQNKSIVFFNTGEPLSVSEDELFARFKKNDSSKDSLGLGLSIVKSITSLYDVNVNYQYSSNKHVFTIQFT
jgi:signal transduction histidine kinase